MENNILNILLFSSFFIPYLMLTGAIAFGILRNIDGFKEHLQKDVFKNYLVICMLGTPVIIIYLVMILIKILIRIILSVPKIGDYLVKFGNKI